MVTEWVISGNPKYYDIVNAFRDLGTIDWKQNTNVTKDDIIYVYISGSIKAIGFKCVARKVDKPKPTIDDSKYNISGEYDGTYGRYMELEMLCEFDGDLFKKEVMAAHGFTSPQSPIRVTPQLKEYLDLVQKLQNAKELDPDSHDGSYELIRETVNAYASMNDLSQLDYKDLNLIYLMSVGTWKQKVPAKKNTINASNLPDEEKKRLCAVLDEIWESAENDGYGNQEAGRISIGMFGTGFFTFQGKTDDKSSREFIKMCIDIKDLDDENAILDRCAKTLTDKFRGMKAASASMVLHCLKPTVFPIFNSNMGADNIFVYLGVDMKWKTEIYSYIKNAKTVKEFRDKNFTVKNYRIFDMAAWDIGQSSKHTNIDYLGLMDYLENNREVPYSNPEAEGLSDQEKKRLLDIKVKGQNAISEMKKMVELCKENFGLDKCEPMAWLDGSNTKTRKYLWAQLKYSAQGDRPESISLFVDMSGETKRARYRFSLELKNASSDKVVVAQYHKHLELLLAAESSLVYMSGSNEFGHPELVEEDQETIKAKIADGTYKKVQICRVVDWDEDLTNDDIENAMLEGVQELIPYYEHVLGIEKNEYWPSLEEYNPGITKEQWAEFLIEDCEKYPSTLQMLCAMVDNGGKDTCILPYSNKPFGVPNNVYIIGTMNTADRSIALMDTALRRRFHFAEMMPDARVLREIGADTIDEAGIKLDVAAMLDTINERIEFLFDREHTIGHAFFTGLKDEPTVAKLASIFKKSIIPLLQEYFYEDYSKIMLVLGDNGKENDAQKFILATETKANLIFRGDTSDIDIPDYSYQIQEKAFYDIMSYIEITG